MKLLNREAELVKEIRNIRHTLVILADELSMTRIQRDLLYNCNKRLWDATANYKGEALWETEIVDASSGPSESKEAK